MADILCSVGVRLGRKRLVDRGRQLALEGMERARLASGQYRLFADLPPSARNFGFFVGLSGIAYAMLRISGVRLPDVLMMESAAEMALPPLDSRVSMA